MQTSILEENKAVVQRYIDKIQNGHSIDAFESIFTDDFVDHTASGEGMFQGGIDGLRQGYEKFLNAFPDLRSTVNLLVAKPIRLLHTKHSPEHIEVLSLGYQQRISVSNLKL